MNEEQQASFATRAEAMFPALMLQAQTTSVETSSDAAHNNPETKFELTDTVFAQATVPGGATARRRIQWVDPDGFVRKTADITSESFNDSFTLPSTQTSDFNGTTLHNIGTWRINIISNRGARVAGTSFTVADKNNAIADLSIDKSASPANSQVPAGSSSTFDIFVVNRGPSPAQAVEIHDTVPANTTFLSMNQTSGPDFDCAESGGVVTCTISSLAVDASAKFIFNYRVNAGTAVGTIISNTATVSSTTTERNNNDNSAKASASVVGGGAADCTLSCPEDISVAADTTENNQEGAHVTFASAESDGDCGTITASPASGSFFPIGTTTVNVTSGLGGGSCSFTVTVHGAAPVTISCPADKTVQAADGECNATVNPGTATATATGGHSVTVTGVRSDKQPLNAPYPGGTTAITWTATDDATPEPHTATCTQMITVEVSNVNDPTPPTITAPPDITVSTGTEVDSSCSAVVDDATIGEPTVTDNCSASFSSEGIPVGNIFPVGTTTITWTATDGAGHTASDTQTVTVHDAAPPKITLNGNSSVTVECHTSFTDPGATAHDTCAGNFAATASGTVNINSPGDYTITYNASDPAGNAAAPVTRTVHVVDTTAPTITVNGANPMTVECHTTFTDPGATAHDGCAGDFAATASGTVNANVPGTYTITYNASDPSGNAAAPVTRTVNVVDTTAPVISCPANITVTLPLNSSATSMVVNYPAVTATDSCSSTATVTTSQASGTVFPLGTTTVTSTATDAAGNQSSCSFTVTVLYNFTGFFQPVGNLPTLNSVNAGRAIPVKFSLSGNKGLNIFAPNSPASGVIQCGANDPTVEVTETVTAGGSSLSYSVDQYNYVWKTESSWAGTCRQLVVTLNDGSVHRANFKFK